MPADTRQVLTSSPSLESDLLVRARAALDHAHTRGDLNAFISLFEEPELSVCPHGREGRLVGMPLAIKDNIDVAGLPCTAGTPGLATWRPATDATVVTRLRRAGAVVIGKSNLHELAVGVTSINPTWGPVHNPHSQGRIAGGSSGGSAAAVAAGIVPTALGTDTAGSCRIPAALCGCTGYRPTLGRYPSDGVLTVSSTRDTVGILARSAAEIARIDDVLCGEQTMAPSRPGGLRGVRLGIPRPYFFDDLDTELNQVIGKALAALKDAGAILVETSVEHVEELVALASLPLILYESTRELSTYLNRHRCALRPWEVVEQIAGPVERPIYENAFSEDRLPDHTYRSALCEHRPALIRNYETCLHRDKLDALVLPTTPLTASRIDAEDTLQGFNSAGAITRAYLRNVDPSAIAGLPSISVPAGRTTAGLPVGLNFDGLPGTDRHLLSLARAFQDVIGPQAGVGDIPDGS